MKYPQIPQVGNLSFNFAMNVTPTVTNFLLLAVFVGGCASGPGAKVRPTQTHFTLELYFEKEGDRTFAEEEAERLIALVNVLAPHIDLEVFTLRAAAITRSTFEDGGRSHNVPNQPPSQSGRQSLLVTNEDIEAEGWAGRIQGCLSKQKLEMKRNAGADSADVTIHEWLHTIEGLEINGRIIPHPHTNASFGFPKPSGRGPDGGDTWHSWYRFALRER